MHLQIIHNFFNNNIILQLNKGLKYVKIKQIILYSRGNFYSMDNRTEGRKLISSNKKAYHDYFVEDKIEAGISLYGTEVKSIRQGNVNLKDSFCKIEEGEIFAYNIHVSPYERGNIFNKDPLRPKKLLLHKKEILKLFNKVGKDGYSIIPLCIYLTRSYVKVELGLCKGKKLYDKREALQEKQLKRENERFVKGMRND